MIKLSRATLLERLRSLASRAKGSLSPAPKDLLAPVVRKPAPKGYAYDNWGMLRTNKELAAEKKFRAEVLEAIKRHPNFQVVSS